MNKFDTFYKKILGENIMSDNFNQILTSEQKQKLSSIKTPDDINSLQILKVWQDDNLKCAKVKINDTVVNFLWYEDLEWLKDYSWEDNVKDWETLKDAILTAVKRSDLKEKD